MSLDFDDPILRRRRQLRARARRRNLILIGAGGLVVLAVSAAGIAARLSRSGSTGQEGERGAGLFGPSPSDEGESWNHADLINHLNGKGFKLSQVPIGGPGPFGSLGSAAYFCGPKTMGEYRQNGMPGANYISMCLQAGSDDIVRVNLHENPQKARDFVGIYDDRGWSWGRFSFTTNSSGKPLLQRICKALD